MPKKEMSLHTCCLHCPQFNRRTLVGMSRLLGLLLHKFHTSKSLMMKSLWGYSGLYSRHIQNKSNTNAMVAGSLSSTLVIVLFHPPPLPLYLAQCSQLQSRGLIYKRGVHSKDGVRQFRSNLCDL